MKKKEEMSGVKPVTMNVVDIQGDNNAVKTGEPTELDDKTKIKQLMQLVEKMNNQNKYLQGQLNGALNTFNFKCIDTLLSVMDRAEHLDVEFNKRVAYAAMEMTDNLIDFLRGGQQGESSQEEDGKPKKGKKGE